jgi:CRISPR system Cascade subunit CasD
VRADRQGKLICDFHTVQSKNLLNAEGKHRGKQGEYATMVTNRYYLQDAFFTVFLIGAKDCLQQVENALQKPQWTLYLGRKSCVPSRPVLEGSVSDYETMEQVIQAIKSFPLSNRHDNKSIMLEMEDDFADKLEMKDNFADFSGNILLRQDELTEDYRQFANRNVMRIFINDDNKEGDANVSDKINS